MRMLSTWSFCFDKLADLIKSLKTLTSHQSVTNNTVTMSLCHCPEIMRNTCISSDFSGDFCGFQSKDHSLKRRAKARDACTLIRSCAKADSREYTGIRNLLFANLQWI